ncbi:MAG: cysteine desulfurase, partial [Propionibacteriaceae bacterium]|nr:cysteine desulfurase [Propionibacteriaceae bacterium]
VVEDSRETMAEALQINPGDLIFTSGGTEADNMAILGIARARRAADPRRTMVLTSPIEHHAVMDSVHHLVKEGFTVVDMPVTDDAIIDLERTCALIGESADCLALVTCLWVNNEIGTVQPVADLAEACHRESIPFHSDAVQAHLLPTSLPAPASLAWSAHKLGGPMGIGALVLPRTTGLDPISFGGGQERKLRSGTLAVPLIAAFADAVLLSQQEREAESARLSVLAASLELILRGTGAEILGTPAHRSPAITYALFPGCSAQDLVVLLDEHGIDVSPGSACTAGIPQPSQVLLALGLTEEQALSGLRFSLGWTTTADDLDALGTALPQAVARARRQPWPA